MASLQNSPAIHRTLFPNSFSQLGLQKHGQFRCCRRGVSLLVRAEQVSTTNREDGPGRRQVLAVGAIASWVSVVNQTSISFAAETKKGFLAVMDKKDGYSFLYPFGWQEVVIDGQDKVFKDVIEPLESVSVNMIPLSNRTFENLGLHKRFVLPSQILGITQYWDLLFMVQHDVDGKAYYTFEFTVQAANFTRHALSAITIGNGKFYTVTTGANERRWEKMKDKLHTVIDSFQIFNV
ncbi:PsbP-like protein 1, chloroplastic [Vitis vinifera]|uniref:PsbP-like protein 1, chloroplastic n=1 Tax=Vitis vinifera TaxID=29760 RepID=A0A438ENU9_VITVI|nr:PsbP-like protein 1, chloroplastic [Vitis vinifera]